jgi:hypothetical protein
MTTSDVDAEQLINRFCGSLAPADRAAFRVAAQSALATIVCAGEGVAYRTLRDVWRGYFRPPDDNIAGAEPRHRGGKLAGGPPIGADDPRVGGRDRRRFKVMS